MNFFDEIKRNKLKSYFLMFLFSLIIIALGYIFSIMYFEEPFTGMFLAFFFTIVYLVFAWFGAGSMILAANKAKPITKQQDPYLYNTVEAMALAAGIPLPKVYVINEESMNAFATGRDPKHAAIAVTSGLRKRMDRQEIEGVIAHEMSHIKNFDIRFMMIVTVLLGVVVLLSDIMLRSVLFGGGRRDNKGGGVAMVIGIVLAILAPIFAYLIRMAISRKREFLADATGAQLSRNNTGLASALKKIRDDHDKVVDTANKSMEHLYIENPLRNKKGFLSSLFSTHPDINERIKRLEAM